MAIEGNLRTVSSEDSSVLTRIRSHLKGRIPHVAKAREAAAVLKGRGLSVVDIAGLVDTEPGVLFPAEPFPPARPAPGELPAFVEQAPAKSRPVTW